MANGNQDIRGTGWAFPVNPNPPDTGAPGAGLPGQAPRHDPQAPAGSILLARLDDSIRQSILLIIGTAPGERAMRPDFGCGIHNLVFAPNDATTAAMIQFEVREALVDWEPRIEVQNVQVAPDPVEDARLLITLRYRVRSTNNVFNLVFPFYLQKSGV